MSTSPVRFYFDYLSPYAYLAWHELHALCERCGRSPRPVPVLLAALLNRWGHKGPAEIPPKRIYLMKDVLRRASHLGLPLAPPPAHPFNPLLALRVSSLDMDEQARRRLITGLFAEVWGGGRGVTDPAVVARVANEAGLDGPALLELAGRPDTKARLRSQTDAALVLGVFGVPTLIVDGELFWGHDSLPYIERFLRGDDRLDRGLLETWRTLPAAARRS